MRQIREAARQPVDISLEPIDLPQIDKIPKDNFNLLQEQIRHKDIREGKPVILTMKTGEGS